MNQTVAREAGVLARFLRSFFLLDTRQARNQAMEGLRAYAVLLVFLVHCVGNYLGTVQRVDADRYAGQSFAALHGQLPLRTLVLLALQKSHHGVDLFFMLSGFLIYRIWTKGEGRSSYGGFIGRRFLRIYPAFLLSLAACCWVYVGRLHWFPLDGKALAQNFLFLNGCPGFDVRPYNNVTWSLFYEFFFYLIFPLLFLLLKWVRNGDPGRRFLGGVLLLGGVLVLHAWLPRFQAFYFGILMGMCDDASLTRLARAVPTWLVLLVYAAAVVPYKVGAVGISYFLPLFGGGAALLVVKACFGDGLLNRVFCLAPLRLLGNLSYSFYLTHALAIALMTVWLLPALAKWPGAAILPLYVGACLAASVCLSVVLFAVAERWYFWLVHAGRAKTPQAPLANPSDPLPAGKAA